MSTSETCVCCFRRRHERGENELIHAGQKYSAPAPEDRPGVSVRVRSSRSVKRVFLCFAHRRERQLALEDPSSRRSARSAGDDEQRRAAALHNSFARQSPEHQ